MEASISANNSNTIETYNQEKNLEAISYILNKKYFDKLKSDYSVVPFSEYSSDATENTQKNDDKSIFDSYVSSVRCLKIKRLVYDKEEDFVDCMENVISLFANSGDTLAFVFNRFIDHVDIYAVIKIPENDNELCKKNIMSFKEALDGNFPGSDFSVVDEKSAGADTARMFNDDNLSIVKSINSISAICNIPSEKAQKYNTQNLEKLFNGIVPHNKDEWYSVIIMAESLKPERIKDIRAGLEEMASEIFPFQQHQFQAGINEAETWGEMSSLSNTQTTNKAITKSLSLNNGVSGSKLSKKLSESRLSNGFSWGKMTSKGTSDTKSSGSNHSIVLGKSEATTYTYQSYAVRDILNEIEKSLERIKVGEGLGYWKYATFVCTSSNYLSKSVANYIRSLLQGKDSYIEPSIIKEWHRGDCTNGKSDFEEIKKYILNFTHPVFENASQDVFVNFSTDINTFELANALALPKHSISGIPVVYGVPFGREPHSLSDIKLDLEIGCGYHMFKTNKVQRIAISKDELTKHVFITGSTGSGKSNTIYKLLERLGEEYVNFLVVEPTKGEYKEIIGRKKGVTTFITNPLLAQREKNIEMLHINPFRFPEHIHVLEHLDRLVEIFNVCWPMYAAMPAILKDSIERAYKSCGWDLENSINKYGEKIFPTFQDVVREIKNVLNESDFSAENKGDYTGSLVTRLSSLTKGIDGLLFSSADVSDELLFDSNVIIDLSRIGSMETKSLVMGILVLKLQEHRMEQRATYSNINDSLKHVTVLEEAHNLLKRTSTEQSMESSNLLGKSVEMLANSIAEMRTYGEGFIIADQAPGLLDMSVIRNTNTKIILRLLDYSDRELVGRAAGLSEDQINEIPNFEKGVAAISQDDWLEPVLCKIDKYEGMGQPFLYSLEENKTIYMQEIKGFSIQSLSSDLANNELRNKIDKVDSIGLVRSIVRSDLDTMIKCDLISYIKSVNAGIDSTSPYRILVYDFFKAENAVEASKNKKEIGDWAHSVIDNLNPSVLKLCSDKEKIDFLLSLIVLEQDLRDKSYDNLMCRFVEVYKSGKGVY